MDRVQLRELQFSSPNKEPVGLTLESGLNLIYGASDTGKSFSLDSIDFMLGSSRELKDIPERVGYDKVSLSLESSTADHIVISRSVDGGDYEVSVNDAEALVLGHKHSSKNDKNLSRFLLSYIGLQDMQLKKNAKGEKINLSFRNIANLALVRDYEIVREGSPVLSGQYTSATSEKALFKLLLTGIDDSAFKSVAVVKSEKNDLMVAEEMIAQLKEELPKDINTSKELAEQIEKLEQSISERGEEVDMVQQSLQESLVHRNELVQKCEDIQIRRNEILSLLQRFGLLQEHYDNDLKRLEAIRESGVLLTFVEDSACPLCGASPESQNHTQSCDGDIKSIVDAATAEIGKILQLKNELSKTVQEIKLEQKALDTEIQSCKVDMDSLQKKVAAQLAPELASTQSTFSKLVRKRYELQSLHDLLSRVEKYETRRNRLIKSLEAAGTSTAQNVANLSKSVLGEFSRKVQEVLEAWDFPNVGQVYFDENTFDLVIADKPRGSRGEGLRAITHAAFSVALMEFCVQKGLPHPGFLVMDSPLLVYKEPDSETEGVEQTSLYDRFYSYLSNLGEDVQVVVFEHKDPPASMENANVIHFTGIPNQGRCGLFPC